ncbi:MAG TPA: DUF1553 domain-containing protein [Bryobacteraceae bacterium]|nr:DUF1553 domain-containing protein [Bryobacteraceae bacterium]
MHWPTVGLAGLLCAAGVASGEVSFSRDVAPVLASKCSQCHSSASKMGGLDLTAEADLRRVAGNGTLYRRVTGQTQPQMPMGGRLTDQQIALIKNWVDSGAKIDTATTIASSAPQFTEAQRKYWFFQPVAKPARVAGADNQIDALIDAKLSAKHLHPNPPADKITLLRRATLDLTGLPPTAEETQAFLADDSPKAFEKVVDRLLASPHYGERWGREWLDLARYADTNGFKADETRPNIWRYRDYVIQSFNQDKPYDRFVKEQIAGDEAYPGNLDARVATGFLRHYTDETNQPVMELRRQEILTDLTDTVGGVFMGMTMACARCHDHKFDPILQKDYYRLQAFFANIRADDNEVLLKGADLEAYQSKLADWDKRTKAIRDELDALVEPYAKQERDYYMPRFSTGTQQAINTPPDQRTPYQQLLAFQGMPQITHSWDTFSKKLKGDQKARFDELTAQLKSLDETYKPKPPVAQTVIDNGNTAPPTFILGGGEWTARGAEVQPGFLSILDPGDARITAPQGLNTTGRRLALANWLTNPNNPLTARVMVNRIWQGHFGTGIVASSSDFGTVGEQPTNRPLLDYLAATFVDNGWSVKKLHRAIMLSAAYRQSSTANEAAIAADPDNKLLWRYPRRRAEGEVVRDSMLMVSGKLNMKMGGPGIRPELPAGVNAVGYASWPVEKDSAEADRRSVYVFVKRVLTYPMFEAFDAPNAGESCPRRFSTVVPSQALTMMNDKQVIEWSQALAGRVLNDAGLDPAQRIERAYRLALARPPSAAEKTSVSDFLKSQTTLVAGRLAADEKVLLPENMPTNMDQAQGAAFVDFCHALISSNEFMYIN